MKKKIISAALAATLVITSAMPAFATPNQEVIENQKKYDELTQKIEDINFIFGQRKTCLNMYQEI